jgi:hypothetical protein
VPCGLSGIFFSFFDFFPSDVGITLRVLDIVIPDTDYQDGPAQGLDKLDLHAS